jgi:hypothetical protein
VAIKRRQAQGRTLAEIQTELVGASERTLRRIAALPDDDDAEPYQPTAREFWREPPSAPRPTPLLSGLELGRGVLLMLPGRPTPSDIEEIQAAAGPLLDLLAERRLTRGSAP